MQTLISPSRIVLIFTFSLCTFLLVLANAALGQNQEPSKPKTLTIGAAAPDFSLPGVDGKTYQLDDFSEAKVLAIIFSCNHCPTAQAYEDRMIQLRKDYSEVDMAMVVVSPNSPGAVSLSELGYTDVGDSFEDMKLRANDKGYNFPYLYDGDEQAMAIAYGPIATPHAFVFDKDRTLQYIGRLDASEKPGTAHAEDIRKAIDALLKGEIPQLAKTKTFGCSVKWGWKKEWKEQQLQQWAQDPVDLKDVSLKEVSEIVKNEGGEKLRLINLWATWCGPCVMEFPEFVAMDRMYRDRNFEFVSISTDRSNARDQALKLLRKFEAANNNYIVNSEDKYAMIEAIDPEWQGALPYTILVEPGGKVVYRQEGAIDPLAIKKAIVNHQMMGRVY